VTRYPVTDPSFSRLPVAGSRFPGSRTPVDGTRPAARVTRWIDARALVGHAHVMRQILATLGVALVSATIVLAEPLSEVDRQRVLAHFAMTDAWLASEVAGLTSTQQGWKGRADAWSVTEVVEHLAVAEAQYWTQLQASLTQPLGQRSSVPDDRILWYGIDRTSRARTGEARVPSGRYATVAAALAAFEQQRGVMRTFATSTHEDLRGRLLKDSQMDVYQWLLMISTHSQRHILQIREIKATPAFPKS
jgi:hypothetical protein